VYVLALINPIFNVCFYISVWIYNNLLDVYNLIGISIKFLFYFRRNQRQIKVYSLGSSLDPNVLHEIVINIIKNVTYEENSVIYFALSGPLIKQFELRGDISSHKYTKKKFFPHLSMESTSFYLTSVINLLYNAKHKPYFGLMELHDIFSLVLYKIIIKTD